MEKQIYIHSFIFRWRGTWYLILLAFSSNWGEREPWLTKVVRVGLCWRTWHFLFVLLFIETQLVSNLYTVRFHVDFSCPHPGAKPRNIYIFFIFFFFFSSPNYVCSSQKTKFEKRPEGQTFLMLILFWSHKLRVFNMAQDNSRKFMNLFAKEVFFFVKIKHPN